MKNITTLLNAIILLIFTSCSISNTQISSNIANEDQLFEKLARSIIDGFENRNYLLFSKYFTPELKERFKERNFNASIESFSKRYGKLKSIVSMGKLKISGMDVFFWKAKFANNKNDVLIRLVIGKLDGVYSIFGWSIE